jgi:hypothetical protein
MTHTPEPSAVPMESIEDAAPPDAGLVERAIVMPITAQPGIALGTTAAGTVRKRPKAGERRVQILQTLAAM